MARADRLPQPAPPGRALLDRLCAGDAAEQAGKPGRYRFYVARTWSTKRLPDGLYRLEVSAADAHGNSARAGLPFTIANRTR